MRHGIHFAFAILVFAAASAPSYALEFPPAQLYPLIKKLKKEISNNTQALPSRPVSEAPQEEDDPWIISYITVDESLFEDPDAVLKIINFLKAEYGFEVFLTASKTLAGEINFSQAKRLRQDKPAWMRDIEVWSWDPAVPGAFSLEFEYVGACSDTPMGQAAIDAKNPLNGHREALARSALHALSPFKFSVEDVKELAVQEATRDYFYNRYSIEFIGQMLPLYGKTAQERAAKILKDSIPHFELENGADFSRETFGWVRFKNGGVTTSFHFESDQPPCSGVAPQKHIRLLKNGSYHKR